MNKGRAEEDSQPATHKRLTQRRGDAYALRRMHTHASEIYASRETKKRSQRATKKEGRYETRQVAESVPFDRWGVWDTRDLHPCQRIAREGERGSLLANAKTGEYVVFLFGIEIGLYASFRSFTCLVLSEHSISARCHKKNSHVDNEHTCAHRCAHSARTKRSTCSYSAIKRGPTLVLTFRLTHSQNALILTFRLTLKTAKNLS